MARPGLTKNIKFKLLVARLGLPRPYVVGLLEMLWEWAHESGTVALGCAQSVECAAEWPGESGKLFEALRDGRWIDETDDGGWIIHDYYDHAPRYVKERLRKELNRKKESRKTGRKPAQKGASTAPQSRAGAQTGAPLPSPLPTPPIRGSTPLNPPSPAGAGGAKEKRPLPRDHLFDAIAELSGADVSLAGVGARIGKVQSALSAADPPYTAADVRRLPDAIRSAGMDFTLTIDAIGKWVHLTRKSPARAGSTSGERFNGLKDFVNGDQSGTSDDHGLPQLGGGVESGPEPRTG